MPDWFLALIASSVLSGIGLTWKKNSEVNDRVDKLEIRLVENYATKGEVESAFDKVDKALCRFENKLDALVMSELRSLREGFVDRMNGSDG